MELEKIGTFLQALRKEKGLTQEMLAEQVGVSRRTVSRWETGSNMPDLDVLVELSDFYAVDLREILNGERKCEQMNEELKETVLQVADYSNEEKSRLLRRMHWLFIAGLAGFIVPILLVVTLLVRSLIRDKKQGKSFCGGNCASCGGCCSRRTHWPRCSQRRLRE